MDLKYFWVRHRKQSLHVECWPARSIDVSETAVVLVQPNEHLPSFRLKLQLCSNVSASSINRRSLGFHPIESSPVFVAACFGSHGWQFPNLARDQPQRREELVMISSQHKRSHLAHSQKQFKALSISSLRQSPKIFRSCNYRATKADRPCSTG